MRYVALLLLVGCARPVPADIKYTEEIIRPANAPSGYAVQEESKVYELSQPPPPPRPYKKCEEWREWGAKAQAALPEAVEEREAWFKANCSRQIPKEVDIRLSDGKRFERVSPNGVYWVCKNGQITDTEMTPRESDLRRTILISTRFLRDNCQ